MKPIYHFISIACMASLLCSCVSMTPPPAATTFEAKTSQSRQTQLQAIRRWNISGALSIRQNQKAQIANFSWKLSAKNRYQVRLSSSLNVYNILIKSTAAGLSLNQNDKQAIHASSATELMEKSVGFALPINNLYYWVRGLNAPGQFKAQYDQYGHLSELRQQGWHIRFMRYTHVNKVDLPQLVQMSRNNLTIRIVIKRWGL